MTRQLYACLLSLLVDRILAPYLRRVHLDDALQGFLILEELDLIDDFVGIQQEHLVLFRLVTAHQV